jgi:precorrin-6A synthase
MRKILIIGIGAGDPDQVTIQAIKALNRADLLFIPDKGVEKIGLRQIRTEICDRYIERRPYRSVAFAMPTRAKRTDDYPATVEAWHAEIAALYARLIMTELGPDECGAFLVWGDPGLYDSTLRIVDRLRADGLALDHEVIPGISSVQALAARHRIPLNQVGEPMLITPGRRLGDHLAENAGTTVVLLDGDAAFDRIDPDDTEIFWGACLGTAEEVLVAGRLAEVKGEIETARARIRERAGWIMDTYLLRRMKRQER